MGEGNGGCAREWREQGKSDGWSAGVLQMEGGEMGLGRGQPLRGLAERNYCCNNSPLLRAFCCHAHSEHLATFPPLSVTSASVVGSYYC